MSKKQIKAEAKRLMAEFQTKEMAKKSIAEIQRVLVYFPALDGYGCNWRAYFKDVDAEVGKM